MLACRRRRRHPQPSAISDAIFSVYLHASGSRRAIDLDSRNLDYTLMGVFFGVGAVAAAGTVVYYFVDTADGGDGSASVRVVPIISQQTQGFGLVGSF